MMGRLGMAGLSKRKPGRRGLTAAARGMMIALALGAGGCAASVSPVGGGPADVGTAPSDGASRVEDGRKKLSNTEHIRLAVAKLLEHEADGVQIEIDDEVKVEGLTLFRYELDGGGERGAFGSGVDGAGGTTIGFDESAPRLAKALGATRDPVTLARAFGVLDTDIETATALLEARQVTDMPDDWRPHVKMPSVEASGDGYVLTYWCESGEPPLFEDRITVKSNGEVTRKRREIWDFLR